jgi:hypothetical protein
MYSLYIYIYIEREREDSMYMPVFICVHVNVKVIYVCMHVRIYIYQSVAFRESRSTVRRYIVLISWDSALRLIIRKRAGPSPLFARFLSALRRRSRASVSPPYGRKRASAPQKTEGLVSL